MSEIQTAQRRAEVLYAAIADEALNKCTVMAFVYEFAEQTRRAALREAAKVAREFSKAYDIEWWRVMTKKEISAAMCRNIANALDRLASEGE